MTKQKETNKQIDPIKNFQLKRKQILSAILLLPSEQGTSDIQIYTDEMAEKANMNHSEFITVFKSLNGCYGYSGYKSGTSTNRYRVNINQCLSEYSKLENIENYEMQTIYQNKVYKLTVLMFVIAFLQAVFGYLATWK